MTNYSFDVFDTLISRRFANDKGVLLALREKLRELKNPDIPHYFIDEFVTLRMSAQNEAHKNSSNPEITLEEIYSALSFRFPEVKDEIIQDILRMEELIEIENCYSIIENVNYVMSLIESGNNVLLISDMYLSKTVIYKMLERADKRLLDLKLYVSSEIKLRKADGDLYDYVCKDQNIKPSSLLHTGDNFHSDCLMAEKSGVKSKHYKSSFLNSTEKSYFKEELNIFLQLVAGTSKKVRLNGYNEKPSYRLGGNFMGPMFYGFVFDLLNKSAKEGIKRVYFLARDAYLFKVIAEEIITCFKFDITIDYLYTSRQSTYFASIFKLTPQCFHWVFQEMDNDITFNRVSKRIHMESNELLKYLNSDLNRKIVNHGLDNRLTSSMINSLKDEFLNNSTLKSSIEFKAEAYRNIVIEYYKQEGVFEDKRVAFVDIGWQGTLQDATYRVLKSEKPNFKVTSFYFAVTRFSTFTTPENRKVPGYLYPSSRPVRFPPIIEQFMLCDHGTTLTYVKNKDGKIEPVLKAPTYIKEWGLDSYMKGIRDFSRNLSSIMAEYPSIELSFSAVTPILVEVMEDAVPDLAAALGDLLYSGDIEESNFCKYAPPFSSWDAILYMFSSSQKREEFTKWFNGSYSRSKLIPKLLLDLDPRKMGLSVMRYFTNREQINKVKLQFKRFIQIRKARVFG